MKAEKLLLWCYKIKTSPMPWLLVISAFGLYFNLTQSYANRLMAICGQVNLAILFDPDALRALIWNPSDLVLDWLVMLLLMMSPLINREVRCVWRANPKGMKTEALIVFVSTYLLIWMFAGLIVVPLGIATALLFKSPDDTFIVIALALIWSASPFSQKLRNRCHRCQSVSVDGLKWVRDNVRYSVKASLNCVAICCPWMVIPLTVEDGHTVTMLAIALILYIERMQIKMVPKWQLPPALNILKMGKV